MAHKVHKKKEVLQLRVPLDEAHTAKFEALKKKRGLTLDTETVRSIINSEYDRVFGTTELPKEAPE